MSWFISQPTSAVFSDTGQFVKDWTVFDGVHGFR